MRKLIISFVTFAATCFGMAANSEAGILSSMIETGFNSFKDNSVAIWEDLDGSTTLSQGDILAGFIRFDQQLLPPPTNTFDADLQIVVFFAIEISNVAPLGGGIALIDHIAPTVAGYRVQDYLDFMGPGFFNDDTMFAVFSKANEPNNVTEDTFAAGLSDLESYTFEFSGGIAPGSDDFFQVLSVADPNAVQPGSNVGLERAALSVFRQDGIPLVEFQGDTATQDFANNPVLADIVLNGQLLKADTAQAANGYAFGNDTAVSFNAVVIPEPSSMLVWAGALGGLGLLAGRRRRREQVESN